jgi:hypothetical protein
MRSAWGQGTVEYLAVVLLVALVMGGGTAAAARATDTDLETAVPHQIRRALCIVTGGDCDRDRAACDVATDTTSSSWGVGVAVFRVGHGKAIVVERRSDGSYLVTLTKAPSAGVQTIDGAHVRIDRGRRQLSVGGAMTASAVASLGHGQSWVAPDESAARALVAALERGDDVRPADQELHEATVVLGATASRGTGGNVAVNATGTLSGEAGIGERVDRPTGAHTYFLHAGADATLELTASLRDLTGSATGTVDGDVQLALTVDRAGRWTDLAVVGSGDASGAASPPRGADRLTDTLGVPTAGGRRWTVEAHLDLSDPGNAAAAHGVVDALLGVRPAAVRDAADDLARRVRQQAVVDVRTYALDRASSGFDVKAGDGFAGLSANHERSTEKTRLIAARTRGLDGQWRSRDDCLKEAHG